MKFFNNSKFNKLILISFLIIIFSLPTSSPVSASSSTIPNTSFITSMGNSLTSFSSNLALGWSIFIDGLLDLPILKQSPTIQTPSPVILSPSIHTEVITDSPVVASSPTIVEQISQAGLTGNTGQRGIQGEQGPRGLTGPQGPKGDKGENGTTPDISSLVSKSFLTNQVNRIYDSTSDNIKGLSTSLSEKINTKLLTVTGDTTIGGNLTVTGDITGNIIGNAITVTNGVYTNTANLMTNIAPLTTLAESWIGPSSTSGIYFKDGNVGVGTTEPYDALAVVSANKSLEGGRGQLGVFSSDDMAVDLGGQIILGGVDTTGGAPARSFASIAGRKENGISGNRAGYLQFSARVGDSGDLTEYMRITSTGNVGIGTTSPKTKLEVVGNGLNLKGENGGNPSFRLYGQNNGAFGAQQIFYKSRLVSGVDNIVQNGDRTMEIRSYGYDGVAQQTSTKIMAEVDGTPTLNSVPGRITFYTTKVGETSYEERMRIDNVGNVGIGTTSPGAKLEVAGAINVNNGAIVSTRALSTNYVITGIVTGDNTNRFGIRADGYTEWGPGNSSRDTFLYRSAVGTLRTSGNFIADGNVGIGTTAPTQKLDVAGSINVSAGSGYMYNGVNVITAQPSLYNYFIANSGNSTMTGSYNTANSDYALYSNTTGFGNIANGFGTLYLNTTGSRNIGIGLQVLNENSSGNDNTAIGYQSMNTSTLGNQNTAIGSFSLFSNRTGSSNTSVGYASGGITTGSNNTFIGASTGVGITTGSNNTILGANVTGLSATLSSNIIIADGAGNRRINVDSTGNVGIGTTSPAGKLDVFLASADASTLPLVIGKGTAGNYVTVLNNGNVGIGTTEPGAMLNIVGTGTTSGTNSLLVQNSTLTNLFKIRDDGYIFNGDSTFQVRPYVSGGTTMLISNGGHNNAVGINVSSALGIYAKSLLGVSSNNVLGASIYAGGGASTGNISLGIISNRALITSAVSGLAMENTAMLQVDSTTQGFLSPRMTATQRDNISTPAIGLQVYNTTTNTVDFYNGTNWQSVLIPNSSGSVGIGTTNPGQKLDVAGTIRQSGCATAGTISVNASGDIICTPSSISFKNNRVDLLDGLETLLLLNPVSYKFNSGMDLGDETHFGFIAEEVNSISQEFATHDKNGNAYGLDTTAILAVTVNAIKEMNLKVEAINYIDNTEAENSFRNILISWFGNVGNGIKDFYANRVHTKEICVEDDNGETCITRDQLDSLLSSVNINTNTGNSGSSDDVAPTTCEAPNTIINEVCVLSEETPTEKLQDANIAITALVEEDYTTESFTSFTTAKDTALSLLETTDEEKLIKSEAINDALALLVLKLVVPTCGDTQTLVDNICTDNIIDTIDPVIILNESDEITPTVGDSYEEL